MGCNVPSSRNEKNSRHTPWSPPQVPKKKKKKDEVAYSEIKIKEVLRGELELVGERNAVRRRCCGAGACVRKVDASALCAISGGGTSRGRGCETSGGVEWQCSCFFYPCR